VSPFLLEVRALYPGEWFEPDPDDVNPVTSQVRAGGWPSDPLGVGESGRRAAVEQGAALVRAAAQAAEHDEALLPEAVLAAGRPAEWARDVDLLLAERAAARTGETIDVPMPEQLSVSQLVELERDPAELARRIRRPVPARPAPLARRGTRFHSWLEQRWQAQPLLDLDELPGAADAGADDRDFDALRAAFEASVWADRRPAEVEVPFEMAFGGTVVRGRMDAVFGSAADGWLVVDWKTGAKPTGAAAKAAAIQLAAYRLAWARLAGIPDDELHRVRAAFHYVRSNETVEPVALLDADGLRELIGGG
jgi:DNA helicase-2/ATP-dependent DNA helicase PcrA